MSSRRNAVLISAALLFLLGGGVLGGAAFATQTAWGREQIREYAQDLLNETVLGGKWHLGRLGGSLFTEVTLDTFAIREPNDSLFISTGPLRIRFSPRDLWDRRILVQAISVQHPVVHLRKDSLDKWNYNKIFPSGPPGPPRTTRKLGDYIAVSSAEIVDGQFHLTQPWRPTDSLRGTRLDSAVAFALARRDKAIRRSGSHFAQTRSWRAGRAVIPWARISDPDSLGRFFELARLDAVGFDPPLSPRNARGTVRILKDSLWLDLSHFELLASRGTASGKVVWGSDLPTRYDLQIRGDSVSMSDVAWVYPTLPTTGGGRMNLQIRNESDLRVIDYALSDMDVQTVKSRLRGNMTFGVGGEVLIVKDVAMRAEPVDWELIEDLTGKPLPYPWKGSMTVTLAATGGPVNAWRIERGDFALVDANVPGATARGRARGEIDMLFPAFTKFHGLEVELDHFDLATIQFLNPLFPRLDGSISGRATLDSVWTDLRFRNSDITHHFGEEPKSRFTGSGRVTLGEKFLTYDLAMSAEPLELNTIAKAWPELLLEYRGTLSGPVRLEGTAEDLAVAASLTGGPGALVWDGRVDIDSVGGYGYHGTLQFTNGNLRALYDTAAFPVTSLNGTAVVDIVGDSLLNFRGPVSVDLARSWIDSTRVYDGARLRLRFMDGVVRVDSAWMETGAGTLVARGGLGLRPEHRDSLVIDVRADSLGGARPYLRRLALDSIAASLVDADSLLGLVDGRLTLAGSIDTLSVRGGIDVRDLQAYASAAGRARVQLDLGDVTSDRMRGRVSVTGDSLRMGTVRFANGALDAEVFQADSASLHLMAESTTGQTVDARGTWNQRADTSTLALSQARLGFDDHEWRLARPGVIRWSGEAFAVDSVMLRGSRGGSVLVHGDARDSTAVSLQARGDSLALEDLAALGQVTVPIAGALSFDARFSGARENPNLTLTGRLTSTKVGQVTLSETALRGRASNQRFVGGLTVLRGDTAVLDVSANLPVDLALASRSVRLLDDTLRVSAISRDLDLRLVESFTPALSNARGRLNTNMSVAGRRGRETLEGFLRVDSAAVIANDLGLGLRGIEIDLRAARDTLRFERFRVVSGDGARNALSLGGFIAINRWEDPAFDLSLDATEFHAINRRRTGDLTVSAGLRFSGRESASQLTGSITVNNGYVAIPVLSSKEIISLNDPAFASIIDTTLEANRRILPRLPRLLQGIEARQVSIAMGPDVWLRSPGEANIKLGGSVNVIQARALATGGTPQLAVEGALRTERGTFNVRFGDLLQRNFTVEGGEITFYGDADFNPTLNINTLYTVRQRSSLYSDRSIRIRARLAGTLVQPRLDFESADSLQVSPSDLISYLISGRPTSEIGLPDRYYVRDLLFTNFGAAFSARFSGQYFDYVQFQSLAGGDVSASGNNLIADLGIGGLAGTTVGAGKQLTDRIFISLTTGLCPLQTFVSQASNNTNLSDLVGGSLEVTIRRGLGVSVNREPPLAAVLCTQQTNGFAANRGSQFSVDLFRSWRW